MKTLRSLALSIIAVGSLASVVLAPQDSDPIDAARLKQIVTGLGFEPKSLSEEAGKEKYEFTVKTDEFDVPIAAEISASKNYVWLTVYLGDAPTASSPKCHAMLSRNFKIQPTQFYITERGALMMGFAMENRGVTPAVFKRTYTKLADDVVKTADIWNATGTGGPEWAR
jgi:hypothetical protein